MFIYSHTIKMSQLNRYPSVCMYVSESCNYYLVLQKSVQRIWNVGIIDFVYSFNEYIFRDVCDFWLSSQ